MIENSDSLTPFPPSRSGGRSRWGRRGQVDARSLSCGPHITSPTAWGRNQVLRRLGIAMLTAALVVAGSAVVPRTGWHPIGSAAADDGGGDDGGNHGSGGSGGGEGEGHDGGGSNSGPGGG